jgi:magnesium chelatase family protein
MLALRLSGILPPMVEDEALASAALQGLATQRFDADDFGVRPFRSPHHSGSSVALVGGGSPPRPGEFSLAHGGLLFLDELSDFLRAALEALREPLESGQITISRAARQAVFPARIQLVAAMNPCPCGYLRTFSATGKTCRYPPGGIARYRTRLSGPLLDRIDLQVEVHAVKPEALMALPDGEASAVLAERVTAARQRQLRQQAMPTAQLDAARIDALCAPEPEAARFAQAAAQRLNWSSRSLHWALKVARTIADLAGAETLITAHVAEALQLRRSLSDAMS